MSAERQPRTAVSCRTLGNHVDSPTVPSAAWRPGPGGTGPGTARNLDHVAGIAFWRALAPEVSKRCGRPVRSTRVRRYSPTSQPWATSCLKAPDGRHTRRLFGAGRHYGACGSCTGTPRLQWQPPKFRRRLGEVSRDVGDASIGRHYIGQNSADNGSD